MEKDTLTEDLTVVGLVLIMLVMCSVLFIKIYKIEKELIQAKQLVVEYYEHAEIAYEMVHSLNNEFRSAFIFLSRICYDNPGFSIF